MPLFIFPITVPMIIAAVVSTRRLEGFLSQPEIQKEFEGVKTMARIMSRSDASLDVFEIDESDGQADAIANNSMSTISTATTISSASMSAATTPTTPSSGYPNDDSYDTNSEYYFEKIPYVSKKYERNMQSSSSSGGYTDRRSIKGSVKLKKNNQISINVKTDRNRMRQKSASKEYQFDIANDLVVCVRNGKFTWHAGSGASVLTVDKLDIPRGIITILIRLS